MASNKVEFSIKGLDGLFYIADVTDFQYRLNRTAFETSSSNLKSLGGTFSTKVKLSKKSKRNGLIFVGKTSIASFGKFNSSSDYEAVIKENGSEVARGTFRLQGVNSDAYEGIFLDKDSDFIEKLDKIRMNRLGYVDDKPTWLVPFNGAITFDEVNDLSNRETDFICPTIIYNNTPVLDYLDLEDGEIWGEYDLSQDPPTRLRSGFSLPNDFDVVSGFPSTLRMGLKFNHFPPALYYRNVIERVCKEVGLSVDCSLFYEDWFNKIYMTYEGSEYVYNWRNIASVYSPTATTLQSGFDSLDEVLESQKDGTVKVNRLDLPFLGGGAPTQFWISDEHFLFKKANIIKHDTLTLVDKCTLTNSFDRVGQYSVPSNGIYKIKTASQYENKHEDFTQYGGGNGNGNGGNVYWLGNSLINAFGTWDADSNVTPFENRRYSWDDNMLIVLKKDENGTTSPDTMRMLYEWMNGQNKDFTTEKSDVIAYFSPKRWVLNASGIPVPNAEVMGSPYSEFESVVKVGFASGSTEFVSHELVNNSTPKHSKSKAEIEIEIELNEGDLIEIFWISLGNIYGEVNRAPQVDLVFDYAVPLIDMVQNFGGGVVDQTLPLEARAYYSIENLCGEYDLDLAQNLPSISGKEFISSFIKQFNLHYKVNDRTISFYPVAQYYSEEVYDITSRIDISKGWKAEPIESPKSWAVGYKNDANDRLLNEANKRTCKGGLISSVNYANVEIENKNTYSESESSDLILFSATKFLRSSIATNPYGFGLDSFPYEFTESCSPLDNSICLIKGFVLPVPSLNGEIILDFPSIQSKESFKINKYGDWSLDFGYSPRLMYHLGTANQYTQNYDSEEWGTLVDMPRPDVAFMNLRKHWFKPTVSQFDGENATLTGVNYPTLRYDGENGLYLRYFENLIELFGLSEILTLKMSVTTKDWNSMEGSRKIRFLDQIYRLMSIKDYDVTKRNLSIIKLLKEV